MVKKGIRRYKPRDRVSGWVVQLKKGRRFMRLHARSRSKAMKIQKYFKMKGWR